VIKHGIWIKCRETAKLCSFESICRNGETVNGKDEERLVEERNE